MAKEYVITGMNCPHCQAAVAKAIQGVNGVTTVEVDLKNGKATVDGNHDSAALIEAVASPASTQSKVRVSKWLNPTRWFDLLIRLHREK